MTTSPQHPSPSHFDWLVARAALSDEGRAAGADASAPEALFARLLDGGHPVDAIRLVAAALPPREGIWWAWAAASHAASLPPADTVPPAARLALAAAERWIAAPDDANRRAAWAAAQEAGLESAAGSAAGAAFLTGGSIAPPEIAPVPPPPGIHARMVAGAVLLSAAADPVHLQTLATAFANQGVEILKQLGGWERASALARQHHEAMHEQHERAKAPPAPPPPAGPAAPAAR